jgi:cellulose synthase/poly-beta-1,6-N-acetylglucosamine synthase-like glycosyltransferase
LDACSEGINNNIFRKGANAIGLSSSVIGSGMAFEFETAKQALAEINAVGGFDKPLQLKIVKQGVTIEYLEDALVFDEKVDSSHAFKQQRKRWISSQFIYLRRFFIPSFRQLFRGNLSYFNLAMANNLVLPRAFLLMILPLLIVISFFVSSWAVLFSILLLVLYITTMLMALPAELMNRELWIAILRLPKAVAIMFGTLFRMKESNKTFIHTVHTKTEISNPLFNEHSK